MIKDINIVMAKWQYDKLIEKIDCVKRGLRLVKINQPLKDVLMNDLYAIDGIIKQNRKDKL